MEDTNVTTGTWIDYSRVRECLTFSAVLSHYGIDHPEGRKQIKIKCPFHRERTPSCSINTEDGMFQCFGCGKKGNALEFVVLMEGGEPGDKHDLHEGALKAIDIMGLSVDNFQKNTTNARARAGKPRNAPGAAKDRRGTRDTKDPRNDAPEPPDEARPAPGNKALDLDLALDPEHPFLHERGLDPDTCKAFGIGYCNAGIMKDRIAIPIHNKDGELVAFTGRWPSDEVPDGTERYKLPAKFYKSLELYNLHRAKSLGKRYVVVVEGYWSAIRLHRAGVPAVALMGTSISPDQARLIRDSGYRYAILLLDGDEGGRKATSAILDILAREVYVRVKELPDGVKPDTMSEDLVEDLRR